MSDRLDEEFVASQSTTVFTVSIDGEAVLLDEVEQRLHHLNAPAALVWSCLDGHASATVLARELSDELGVSYEHALTDVVVILRDLDAQGLLQGSTRAEAPA